jgi:hypothetical protein
MAGATRIITPDKVRQLQIALYRKAKAEPKYRFWSLYGWTTCKPNSKPGPTGPVRCAG